ncbi:MAG TPA: hypothetical protein VFO85_07390, partial [Vicinamibacteria bacterium]|nr:hypothetical protein [Vicinamibacteria bacterium]
VLPPRGRAGIAVEALLLLVPVALTSAGAYLLGRRRALAARALRPALARMFECVGLTMVFLLLNTVVGAAATLGARAALGRFVSLYLVTDSVLVALSALQAVALRWWWGSGRSVPEGDA